MLCRMSTPDGPDLRVGDSERESALDALREAAADGRITLSELDERIDATMRSRTRADLRDVLLDIVPPSGIAKVLGTEQTVRVEPGYTWDDPLVLMATWQDLSRRGEWEVPPYLETHSVAGSVRLDFTAAVVRTPVVDIAHLGGAGDLILIVPQVFGVNTDRVTGGFGVVRNRARPKPEAGYPLLRVRGALGMGDIRVRYPSALDRWLSKRALGNSAR